MIVAFAALLAALSGTAVALPGKARVDSGDIRNGTIRTPDIRNNNLLSRDIRNGTIVGRDVRNGSLGGADIDESDLGTVPSASTAGTANSANTANRASSAGSADVANLANNVAASENFHEVGAPGEPAFESGCGNSPPVGPNLAFESVGFYKDREGVVHLKGVYQCPSGGTNIVFHLPPGYRPAVGRLLFHLVAAGGTAQQDQVLIHGDIDRPPSEPNLDGAVASLNEQQVSLDGISFRAAG